MRKTTTQETSEGVAVQRIPLTRIVLDTRLQAREEIDQETVEAYRDAYLNDEQLPPLEGMILDETENIYLVEGWHRYNALKLVPLRDYATMLVTTGTWPQAKAKAAKSNAQHGLRRKPGDAAYAVRLAVESIAEFSAGEWEAWKREKKRRVGQLDSGWTPADLAWMTGYAWSTVFLRLYGEAGVLATISVEIVEAFRKREAKGRDGAPRFDWEPFDQLIYERERVKAAPRPRSLLRLVDKDTGEAFPTIRDEAGPEMATQIHDFTTNIARKAVEQKSLGQQISEAETTAFTQAMSVDLAYKHLTDLLAIDPASLAEAWFVDKRQRDLADWLERMAVDLTDYATAVKAVKPGRRLHAVT